MTFKQQIEAIFDHPFFQLAMAKFISGDDSELRHLFHELQYHVYDKATHNASITYGTNRWLNSCDIKREIRHTEPPKNLDLSMPIPEHKPVPIKTTFVNKKSSSKNVQVRATNQLLLFVHIM